jgi:hypothetical protein
VTTNNAKEEVEKEKNGIKGTTKTLTRFLLG